MRVFKNKFSNTEFKTYYIQDEKEVSKLPVTSNKLYGLDIETAKKKDFKEHPEAGLCPYLSDIRLLQVYDGDKSVFVFDLFHINVVLLEDFLQDNRFVAHNGIFEIKHLTHLGFENLNIGCSMLLSQLVDGAEHSPYDPSEEEDEDDQDQTGLSKYKKRYHGLDPVVQRLFGIKVHKDQQVSDWAKPVLDIEQITYAALDAVLTYKCAVVLSKKLVEYKMQNAYQIVKDTQHVIARMELAGLPVDWEYHKKMISDWTKKCEESLLACKPFFGDANMRSGKQMTAWLLEYLKNDPVRLAGWPKTKKGAYAFGKKEIGVYKTTLPAIKALLEYKKWAKLIDTYGESLIEKKHPITKRLHTSYILGETLTGRLSSRKPNCQNYPRDAEFRNMFAAPEGYVLVVSDFSQIEVRLQAEFSQDPIMCAVYKEGRDIYRTMASMIYRIPEDKISKDQRYIAKQAVLALAYGMGPPRFETYCTNADVPPQRSDFYVRTHQTYHSTVNVYSRWCNKIRDRASKLGYIETFLGKRRRLTEEELYTKAPNHVIQGTAAELMENALLRCQKKLQDKWEIVATVHDEVLLLVPKKDAEKAIHVLADSMNQAMRDMFPNAVSHDVAETAAAVRWGEAKAEL